MTTPAPALAPAPGWPLPTPEPPCRCGAQHLPPPPPSRLTRAPPPPAVAPRQGPLASGRGATGWPPGVQTAAFRRRGRRRTREAKAPLLSALGVAGSVLSSEERRGRKFDPGTAGAAMNVLGININQRRVTASYVVKLVT